MGSVRLIPAGVALFLMMAAALLVAAGVLAVRLRWFRSAPAAVRADRLLLAVAAAILVSAALSGCVVASLVDHLLAFHHVPHLCLDGLTATAIGQLTVFGLEGAAVLLVLAVGRQVLRAARLQRRLRGLAQSGALRVSPKMAAAAMHAGRKVGAAFSGLAEVDLPGPNAFVVGAVRPRCVVARSLVDRLSGEELEAVVAHEAAHLRRGDPMARLLLFSCGRAFGFLSPVRALLASWEEAAEMAADDLAVQSTGRRLELARALLAAARVAPALAPALVSGSGALVALRIQRLLAAPASPTRHRADRLASLAFFAALTVSLVLAGIHSPLLPSLHCLVESMTGVR